MSGKQVIEVSEGGDGSATLAMGPGGTRAVRHVCDVLFAVGCIGALTVRLYANRHTFFTGDDWPLTWMGLNAHGFIEQYNGHLSITTVAIYRLSAELFGINNIVPLRVFAELVFVAIGVCIYCIARSRVGAIWALPAALAILFFPDPSIAHSAFNHYLALVGSLLVGWMLARDEHRFDWPIFLVLSVALTSSTVAVAFVMGSCVFLVLTRPRWQRWLAIAVPSLLWLVWYLRYDRGRSQSAGLNVAQTFTFVWRGIASAFVGIAFNNHVLGVLLGIGFVILIILRCRRGWRAAAYPLSWLAAACGWWIALSQSVRALFPGTELMYRYRIATAVFLIMAFLPTDPSTDSNRFGRRWAIRAGHSPIRMDLVGLAAAVLLAIALVAVNTISGTIDSPGSGAKLAAYYRFKETIINQGPDVVGDSSVITGPLFAFPVRKYRAVVKAYGLPKGTDPTHVDRYIISDAGIRLHVMNNPKPLYCVQLEGVLKMRDLGAVFITAMKRPVEVRIRLMNRQWTELGTVGTGQRGAISLPSMSYVKVPWKIEATGGCITYSKARR